jgi:hypothetical protein
MATTPINVFKTYTANITTADEIIYTTPENNTGIVLMAQVANITSSETTITFAHYDVTANTATELVKDFAIPGNDASGVITGKLVVQEGNSLRASASSNGALKITLSILESLNA